MAASSETLLLLLLLVLYNHDPPGGEEMPRHREIGMWGGGGKGREEEITEKWEDSHYGTIATRGKDSR
jgi:hypothetical protein